MLATLNILFLLHLPWVNCLGTLQFRLEAFDNFKSTLSSGQCCHPAKLSEKCTSKCDTFFRVCVSDRVESDTLQYVYTTPKPPAGVRISRIASRRRRLKRRTRSENSEPSEVAIPPKPSRSSTRTEGGTELQVIPIDHLQNGTTIQVIHKLISSPGNTTSNDPTQNVTNKPDTKETVESALVQINNNTSRKSENLAAFFIEEGDYVLLYFGPTKGKLKRNLHRITRREAEISTSGLSHIDNIDIYSKQPGDCQYGYSVTSIVTSKSLNNSPLIMSFQFRGAWIGKYKLVVEAWHRTAPGNNQTNLPHSNQDANNSELIKRYVIPRRDVISQTWSRDIVADRSHQLQYSMRVLCAANTDSQCLTDCEAAAAQTKSGHYRCMEDGLIECLPGWTGDKCDVPICKSGCHPLFGYCVRPNECLCKIGYGGDLCDSCTPLPGCLHGTCNTSFECLCQPGWTGLFCNQPTCADGCDSSRGYCTVPDECSCRVGWTGRNCSECQLLPGCIQGYCDEPLECKCHEGWTGFFCERAICSEGCSREHGYCEKPGVCRCELGWQGEQCDKCFPYPGCVNGGCSQPWQCECHANWTGFLCDKPTDPCGYEPDRCQNEGVCRNVLENDEPSALCECREGFTGDRCENTAENLSEPSDSNTTNTTSLSITATASDDSKASVSSVLSVPTFLSDDQNALITTQLHQPNNHTEKINNSSNTSSTREILQDNREEGGVVDVKQKSKLAIDNSNATTSSGISLNDTIKVSDNTPVSNKIVEISETEVGSLETDLNDTGTSTDSSQVVTGSFSDNERISNSTKSQRSERKVDKIDTHTEKNKLAAVDVDVKVDSVENVGSSLNTEDQAQVIADNIKFVISSFKRMAKNMFNPTPSHFTPSVKIHRRDKLKNRRRPISSSRPYYAHTDYSSFPRYKLPRQSPGTRRRDIIQPRSRNGPFA